MPGRGHSALLWPLPLDRGYYKLFFSWKSGGREHERRIPVAVIDPYLHSDSVFGVNHAPGTDNNCVQLRKAGVVWAREWALNWQQVEPDSAADSFPGVQVGELPKPDPEHIPVRITLTVGLLENANGSKLHPVL